jgi:hypothetical protein
MNPVEVAKDAFKTIWSHKALWVFGLFVASGGGGAGSSSQRSGSGGSGAMPTWVLLLVAAGILLGLLSLVMHVVSEAALIDGVRRSRADEPIRVKHGFRFGLSQFGRVLRVKLMLVLPVLLGIAALATPALLVALKWTPLWVGIAATVPLVLVSVPFFLTLYFSYLYALRIAVFEEKGARVSFAEARRYLSGRVLESVKLLVVSFFAQLLGGTAGLLFLLPAALVGGLVYWISGAILPAVIAGGLLAVPVAVVVAGALGAFGSAIWTVGYLDSRAKAES